MTIPITNKTKINKMLTIDDLHDSYVSPIPPQILHSQGKSLNKQMAKKIYNVDQHFVKVLQNITSDAIFDRDFEETNNLLIAELTTMAASPGKLNSQLLDYRLFLLYRASYAFKSCVVSKNSHYVTLLNENYVKLLKRN